MFSTFNFELSTSPLFPLTFVVQSSSCWHTSSYLGSIFHASQVLPRVELLRSISHIPTIRSCETHCRHQTCRVPIHYRGISVRFWWPSINCLTSRDFVVHLYSTEQGQSVLALALSLAAMCFVKIRRCQI